MQSLRIFLTAFAVLASPLAWAQSGVDLPAQKTILRVSAFFNEGGDPIRSGIQWRVFEARGGTESGDLPEIAASSDPNPSFSLEPGTYIVYCAYGRAAATRRIEVGARPLEEKIILKAGVLKIGGVIGDRPLPAAKLASRIYQILPNERRLIAEKIPAVDPLRLVEGSYFIENYYGDTNATVSATVAVKAGQMTEAIFHHRAATLTLKLVNQSGGEALANTTWVVLTNPSGDEIRKEIGAFPSVILAEGSYTVISRHENRVYQRDFEVKAGLDQDIEVIAQD